MKPRQYPQKLILQIGYVPPGRRWPRGWIVVGVYATRNKVCRRIIEEAKNRTDALHKCVRLWRREPGKYKLG